MTFHFKKALVNGGSSNIYPLDRHMGSQICG